VVVLVAFVVVFVAAFAQAITGFGFALIAVPLLALATDPRHAVVTSCVVSLGATLLAMVRERAHVQWRTVARLLCCALAGVPLGLLVLRFMPDRVLTGLIAVSVLACAALVWRRARLRRQGRAAVAAVGLLVGAMSTATGTNGPPLVAAFQAMGYDRQTFRATLAAVFCGTGVASLAGFVATDLVDTRVLWLGLAGAPAVVGGWFAGDALFARIDATVFRRIVLASLVVIAAVTGFRALTA
jgi:uncharacterized membrane protein YfcA